MGLVQGEKGRRSCRLDPSVETGKRGVGILGSIGEKPEQVDCEGFDPEKGNTRKIGGRVLARSQLRIFFRFQAMDISSI